jgi:hypothetical protein
MKHVKYNTFYLRKELNMSKIKWSNLWKGFAMGTTDLVPGPIGSKNFKLSQKRFEKRPLIECMKSSYIPSKSAMC